MIEPVTIAILSHNRSWSLMQTVSSIRQFVQWPYRIIIHDNGSSEDHLGHVWRLEGDDCLIHTCRDFLSCLDGRRAVLDLVDTEYVAFLDDDIRVCPSWLSEMMGVMLTRENAGAVTCNITQDGRVR